MNSNLTKERKIEKEKKWSKDKDEDWKNIVNTVWVFGVFWYDCMFEFFTENK